MKSRSIFFLAMTVCLACGLELRAQDISPDSIPNGEYWLELKGKVKGTDKAKESKGPVTAVTRDGAVTLTNESQKNYPIVGRLKKGLFTATLNDAGGVVHFSGKLGDGVIKGTIEGTSNDKKQTMEGTFTLGRKKPEGK